MFRAQAGDAETVAPLDASNVHGLERRNCAAGRPGVATRTYRDAARICLPRECVPELLRAADRVLVALTFDCDVCSDSGREPRETDREPDESNAHGLERAIAPPAGHGVTTGADRSAARFFLAREVHELSVVARVLTWPTCDWAQTTTPISIAADSFAHCYDPIRGVDVLRRVLMGFLALPLCLIAAADPFSGTWQLNLSNSKLPPPLPRSQVVHIKATRKGIQVREEIVNEGGHLMTVTVKAKFDGKDYSVSGTPFADTVAYQKIDSHTLKGIVKKTGKVVSTETATVSPDGSTLTGAYTGMDATGKQVDAVAVFERQ